jgi:hypothetical protein
MTTDLSEQQLKVLRLGDPYFSANQYLNPNEEDDDDLCSVVLGPGDVLYHPAGNYIHIYICIYMYIYVYS